MKNLILIGAGDWGFEVYSWLSEAVGYGTEFIFKGFLDSKPVVATNNLIFDAPLLGDPETYTPQSGDVFACTIANPYHKEKITLKFQSKGGMFQKLIHNSALFFKNITIGEGVIISPYCIISNNCKIGNHTALNLMCTLGHDVEIGSYCQLNSHTDITGHVKIEDSVFMGSRVSIIPTVSVCSNTIIGAGAVVIKDVKEPGTYVGNPARRVI